MACHFFSLLHIAYKRKYPFFSYADVKDDLLKSYHQKKDFVMTYMHQFVDLMAKLTAMIATLVMKLSIEIVFYI